MSIRDDNWFEVWFTEGGGKEPAYLLVVKPDENKPGYVVVFDPMDNFKIVHQGQNYEDTRLWLNEDEYHQVQGREFPDDGW